MRRPTASAPTADVWAVFVGLPTVIGEARGRPVHSGIAPALAAAPRKPLLARHGRGGS